MATDGNTLARVVAPDGTVDAEQDPELSTTVVETLYELQLMARVFDEKAVSLHRQGRIGTYAQLRGQEAAQVGAAYALAAEEYCFPTYRDHAMYFTRGISMRDALLYLMGEGNYIDRRDPETLRTFPPTVPIATQLPHAVGISMAAKYRDDERATLVSFGDGATSEGDFHEGMNFAGVFDTPTVFFCQNNGYAISVPTDSQTASATIAQKAEAYGFEGVRVDGNDVLAVHRTVRDALEKARTGGGPTLIEAVTYRRGAHTTTDDPSKYRDEAEVEEWRQRDPLDRTREYLEEEHGWTDADERALREEVEAEVADAVEAAESHSGLDTNDMFDHVFEDGHPNFPTQREFVPDDPATNH